MGRENYADFFRGIMGFWINGVQSEQFSHLQHSITPQFHISNMIKSIINKIIFELE
jgi:hypothetical protein